MTSGEKTSHGNAAPQHVLAVIVNLATFTYGVTTGWLAPMQPILQANYTNTNETSPLGPSAAPLTNDEVSWITGSYCLGGILATPLYGFLVKAIGRKKSVLLTGLPFIFTFIMKLTASQPWMIFLGRFVAGLGGGGISVVAPMYIGETAEVNNRGVLGSYFNLFFCLGIVASYIVGSYTSYFSLCLFCISFPILFVFAWFWLPETPTYSLIQNRTEDAFNALFKLRGNHKGLIEAELSDLSASLKENSSDGKMSIMEMLSEPETRKGFIIGGMLMTVQQMSGISPILNYTVVIFKSSGSDISPNLATIIVGLLQVLGSVGATLLMERAGRKLLLIISSVGMGASLACIAVFFHLITIDYDPSFMKSIGWLPVTCMAVYVVLYGLGFGSVPYVVVGEIFKAEARSAATAFSTFVLWGEAFFLLKFFSKLSDFFGIDVCFGMFAACCAFGGIFTLFYVPETKGKSLDIILQQLGGKETSNYLQSSPIPLVDLVSKKNQGSNADDNFEEKL